MEASREDRTEERRALLREVAADIDATAAYLGLEALSRAVVKAMQKVPRHCFLPPESQHLAYVNRPQRIGHGQTISQPFIVAVMSELAAVAPGDRVLEVGTGCGYQSAVLAELGAEVYSVERVAQLALTAKERLDHLGYGKSVQIKTGDGSKGWPEYAPYSSIVVTATTNARVVADLLQQLAPGGRMIVPEVRELKSIDDAAKKGGDLNDVPPFRRRHFSEPDTDLCLITKDNDGGCNSLRLIPVAFVPLVEDTSGS